MDELRAKLNRVVYGLAALFFLLPFVNFSCAEMPIGSVTGFDMVFGSTKLTGEGAKMAQFSQYAENGEDQSMPNPMLAAENHVIEPSWLVISALGCCLLGLFFSFSDAEKARLARIGFSIGTMLTLLIFRIGIESELEAGGGGMIQVETAIGFWMVMGCMAFAVWLNFSGEQQPEGPFIRAKFDRHETNQNQIRGPKVPQG